MDAETIENFIINMGRYDFTKVVALVLNESFGVHSINVDGNLDGGTDWRLFKDNGENKTVAVQDTVQKDYVEVKAFQDAQKAVQKTGATRYFFFTTRRVSNVNLMKLQSRIASELKIASTCLGATEIAQLIVEENRISKFLDVIDAPLAANLASRPDSAEVYLHAYTNISDEKFAHQNQVYDDSLLLTSKANGPQLREDLVHKLLSNSRSLKARLLSHGVTLMSAHLIY